MCFEDLYRQSQRLAQLQAHRQLLWLSGEQEWCYRQLQSIRPLLLAQNSVAVLNKKVIKQHFDTGLQRNICQSQVTASQCSGFLGQELESIVFDGYSGFHPDSLAIISGTLVAGGVLVLITPQQHDWQGWQEPELDNLWAQPFTVQDVKRNFLTWLKQILRQDNALSRYSQNGTAEVPKLAYDLDISNFATQALLEQTRFVEGCAEYLLSNDTASAVLAAARGRGKSVALGLLANALAQHRTLYLSACDVQAVQQVNHFASSALPYFSPSQLLADNFQPAANALLLVDEAAAISVDVLYQLSVKFPQCVYSTTTQGYEGTGQGFELRFLQKLSRADIPYRCYELLLPMRWAANDPVENWLNQLLLLDLSPVQSAVARLTVQESTSDYCIDKIEPQQLIENPKLLRQLYTLLTQAHYRTKPSDLRIILDSPNLHLWLVRVEGSIVAACLVAQEVPLQSFTEDGQGMNGEQLSLAVFRGLRRPRGNLIPQILIAQEGELGAKAFKIARVVRIATAFSQRRKSLASALLDEVTHWAKAQQFNYIGANFSIQDDLLKFWQQAGFTLLRIGSQLDKVTASYSALVLKNLAGDDELIRRLSRQFYYKFTYQNEQSMLMTHSDTKLFLQQPAVNHLQYLQAQPGYQLWCKQQLESFAFYYRPLESIAYLLHLLLTAYPGCWSSAAIGTVYARVFSLCIIEQVAYEAIYSQCQLSGYRSLVKELRAATSGFLRELDREKNHQGDEGK